MARRGRGSGVEAIKGVARAGRRGGGSTNMGGSDEGVAWRGVGGKVT